MELDEAFHGVAGAVHPVERYMGGSDVSVRAPPFQTVNPCDREPMGDEQPVHLRDRTSADDGEGVSRCRGQAGEQRVQTPAAPDRIRTFRDLDQGTVEVEKRGWTPWPGRSLCGCHARTIQRRRAARKSPAC